MSSTEERHTALIELGRALEGALQPDALLPLIVRTVSKTLDVPYAAFSIRRVDTGEDEIVTEHGRAEACADDAVRLNVTHNGETIGHLLVSHCANRSALSRTEIDVLKHVAGQAGAAANVARITRDLRRARERLVIAREEERRRLRHDLHDSIGPTLAALDLRAGAIRNTISRDPAAAETMILELRQHIRSVITEIRRVVYNLRPPALDELGLLSAIREQAAQFNSDGLHVDLSAPEKWPPLPTAYDVAIYRIVCEALTNVARHSHAHACSISLTLTQSAIHLEVTDDGHGMGENKSNGVGVSSMRNRVIELGGTLEARSGPEGGTRIHVSIPVDLDKLSPSTTHAVDVTIW